MCIYFHRNHFLTVSCAGRNTDAPSSMDETPIVSSETTGEPNEASIPEISENTTLRDNDTETTPGEITTEEAIEEVVAETEPIVYFLLRAVSMTTDLLLNFAVL